MGHSFYTAATEVKEYPALTIRLEINFCERLPHMNGQKNLYCRQCEIIMDVHVFFLF